MPSERISKVKFEIGHVLFIDIVGYSKLLITEQSEQLQKLKEVEKLIRFAESGNHTLLDLAFAWLLGHRPVASVIAGATKPEQVHANAAAVGWDLSADDIAEIDKLLAA
jgi:aryl-alcohol dehydrogenase-like predicted oxidoreductase